MVTSGEGTLVLRDDIANRRAPIVASLIMSGWYSYTSGPDFDIALFDPDGNQVALDDSVERQNT